MLLKKTFVAFLVGMVIFSVSSCKKEDNQAEIDHRLIEEYAEANQLDGQFTASGLYYEIYEEGTDNHPDLYSYVTVNYAGYLRDGTKFDDGEYFTSMLANLIPGWQEGLQLIGPGGEMKLVVPSALGYGSSGAGPIGANEILIFDITLIDVDNK